MEGMGSDGMYPSVLRELFNITARPSLLNLKHCSDRGRFSMTANKQKLLTASRRARNMEGNTTQSVSPLYMGRLWSKSFQSHLYFEYRLSYMSSRGPFLPKLLYGCDLCLKPAL